MTRRLKLYGGGAEGERLSEPERDHLFGFGVKRLGADSCKPMGSRADRRRRHDHSPPRGLCDHMPWYR